MNWAFQELNLDYTFRKGVSYPLNERPIWHVIVSILGMNSMYNLAA